MDQTNAKQVTRMLLATCFVITIIAGGAFALSAFMSNHLNDETLTTDKPLSLVETGGLPGNTATNVAYYLNATVVANVDCQNIGFHLNITRTGSIAEANLTVMYSVNGADYAPLGMNPVDIDTLSADIAMIESTLLAGESMNISYQIVFNDAGQYFTDIYAGATEASG